MSAVCREHSLSDSLVHRWLGVYSERRAETFAEEDPRLAELTAARQRIAELEAAPGRVTTGERSLDVALPGAQRRGPLGASTGPRRTGEGERVAAFPGGPGFPAAAAPLSR